MKHTIILLVISLIFSSLCFAAIVDIQPIQHVQTERVMSSNRNQSIIYQETFENGMGNWVSYDGQVPRHNWHLTNSAHFADEPGGYVWWMGDPTI